MKQVLIVMLIGFMLVNWTACAQVKDPADSWPTNQENTIKAVFIGNSITEIWRMDHPEFFMRNNYVNVGVGGQTTWQMLNRFQQDVVDLLPLCVVIMGGINDIAHNPSFAPTLEGIKNNIASMAELAQKNGIQVIICSTPPAQNVNWNIPVPDATQQVVDLNVLLKQYADSNNAAFVDVHALLRANDNKLRPEYCRGNGDSVHLSPQAYSVIEPVIKHQIDALLRQCK